ncbi:hypothetical protein K435DRAFT_775772 [Dendrothele bispora CBS 962.96]|uniref:Uncharacterized protein n=1 Tax=Dendrothele bispora (strain CBS 962.96) TaxID=1314807 RepID=A0A4S8MH76_DENBC|nr:hypothetical protein K435DRAFT_775772 [Dendrothele bispora CBS 962.96]
MYTRSTSSIHHNGAILQSYPSAPRAPEPLLAQRPYGNLYLPVQPGSQPNAYLANPMISMSTSPQFVTPILSGSRSKSKSRPLTYTIPPNPPQLHPSSAPMKYTAGPLNFGYPAVAPYAGYPPVPMAY